MGREVVQRGHGWCRRFRVFGLDALGSTDDEGDKSRNISTGCSCWGRREEKIGMSLHVVRDVRNGEWTTRGMYDFKSFDDRHDR